MLADLLPEFAFAMSNPLRVRLILPGNWTTVSGFAQTDGYYTLVEPDKAVFIVGRSLRVVSKNLGGREFRVVVDGDWPFTERDVLKTAVRVIEQHVRLTETAIPHGAVLMLLPMAGPSPSWTAETRGKSMVLLLSTNEEKRQLLARLGVILSHESLHLWVPNSLDLQGDYDWFFEGFTLYQALITALRLRLIDFDEYLNTLARVFDSYLLSEERDRFSLLELSERRWTTASSLVYDKGMLVGMIYDLRLRTLTQGRFGLSNIYQKLFKSLPPASANANEVIISLLDEPPGLSDFSSIYVSKPNRLELDKIFPAYGINTRRENFQTRFGVNRTLEQGQKTVLRSIGYKK
jgi:predicted metalloprotease with PDZ domain